MSGRMHMRTQSQTGRQSRVLEALLRCEQPVSHSICTPSALDLRWICTRFALNIRSICIQPPFKQLCLPACLPACLRTSCQGPTELSVFLSGSAFEYEITGE